MKLLDILDELRAMAQTGLNFADNQYDRERYERLLEIVHESYGGTFDLPPEEVRDRMARELGQVTPKVASSAAIFDAEGRVLLVKRPNTGTWCLPGGAVKIGETPAECAERETTEETGFTIEATEVAAVGTKEPRADSPWHTVQLVYLGRRTGGQLQPSEEEAEAVRYWHLDDVPEWFLNHQSLTREALQTTAERRYPS